MKNALIIGAGLAGLITACRIKHIPIYEAGSRAQQHKALLRFRDRSVSDLTGIPFQEVSVHKEIYSDGQPHHRCTIAMANSYAKKVSGSLHGRSIWNLDTVKRYVAPEDFYDQLIDMHRDRIHFDTAISKILPLSKEADQQIISTMPLPVMMELCGMNAQKFDFERSAIRVQRYKLPKGTKLYQTIYFPDSDMRTFRASITGDLLIVESMRGNPNDMFDWAIGEPSEIGKVAKAFGLEWSDVEALDDVEQKYGKIVEIPREQREAILYELTRDFGVFSIGRFATWRNILLDDVVKDISLVERLMASSSYGRDLVLSSR